MSICRQAGGSFSAMEKVRVLGPGADQRECLSEMRQDHQQRSGERQYLQHRVNLRFRGADVPPVVHRVAHILRPPSRPLV